MPTYIVTTRIPEVGPDAATAIRERSLKLIDEIGEEIGAGS